MMIDGTHYSKDCFCDSCKIVNYKKKKPRECCDECNKKLAYCDCEPIGHQTIDTFKALDESLDKLLEDDFVGELLELTAWTRFATMKGEDVEIADAFLNKKFTDLLQRHEAHVREKVGEEIKKDYREKATHEEKMSFASGRTLARVISLITKKEYEKTTNSI
jgi:hypothetical protein